MREFIDLITESQSFFESPFIKELNAWCEAEGAELDMPDDSEAYWDGGDWRLVVRNQIDRVYIEHIQVGNDFDTSGRRQGMGTKIMKAVCALADKHRVTLILMADESNDRVPADDDDSDAESDYDESEHWLQTWYGGMGFEYTGDTGDYGPYMLREPA